MACSSPKLGFLAVPQAERPILRVTCCASGLFSAHARDTGCWFLHSRCPFEGAAVADGVRTCRLRRGLASPWCPRGRKKKRRHSPGAVSLEPGGGWGDEDTGAESFVCSSDEILLLTKSSGPVCRFFGGMVTAFMSTELYRTRVTKAQVYAAPDWEILRTSPPLSCSRGLLSLPGHPQPQNLSRTRIRFCSSAVGKGGGVNGSKSTMERVLGAQVLFCCLPSGRCVSCRESLRLRSEGIETLISRRSDRLSRGALQCRAMYEHTL